MTNDPLFQPLKLGSMTLPNRIVMPPMTRSRASQPGDEANDLMAAYYAQREFRRKQGRWASTFQELTIMPPAGATLQTTGNLFQINAGTLHIRHDSLIWKE